MYFHPSCFAAGFPAGAFDLGGFCSSGGVPTARHFPSVACLPPIQRPSALLIVQGSPLMTNF
jgi:hypothetical protein